jgi:DNA invertase Pin-like site-specific DNA recombinase|tara:strand:- start:120 stop:1274 length:1155 start_codon:yes stop_codon:yes gene_type:complete
MGTLKEELEIWKASRYKEPMSLTRYKMSEDFESAVQSFLNKNGIKKTRFSYGKLYIPKDKLDEAKSLLEEEVKKSGGDVAIMPKTILGEEHDCKKVHPGKRHQEWMKPEVKEELESFDEGRMKDIYTMDQDGKSKEEIAKRLGLKVSTVKSILGEEVLSEFSDAQIDSLKRDYAGLQGKTISGINANKLMKIFDKFDKSKPLLIKLLKAKIPFVSMLAQARLISKHGANAAQLAQMRREQVEQLEEKFQDGFAVRYLDPLNKKRFVVPFKTKKEADDKAAQLKRDGCKDITITKHNLNFKEDSDYLKSKMNDKQISNIKNTWKNKKASDVTQGVKDMIKKMDIPTQLAIKHADIPHLSKLVEKKEVHEGAKKTFARLWSEHKRR